MDLLKPEYNILPKAGSSLGHKHTEKTLSKFRARKFNPEQKAKMQKHLKSLSSSDEHKKRSSARMLIINESSAKGGYFS